MRKIGRVFPWIMTAALAFSGACGAANSGAVQKSLENLEVRRGESVSNPVYNQDSMDGPTTQPS